VLKPVGKNGRAHFFHEMQIIIKVVDGV
jgi:hypothetical protein